MNSIRAQQPYIPPQHPPRAKGFFSSLAISTANLSKSAFYGLGFTFLLATKSSNKQRFKLLMHYHFSKSSSIVAWRLFGKQFIYPSINIEKKETLTNRTFAQHHRRLPSYYLGKYPSEKLQV